MLENTKMEAICTLNRAHGGERLLPVVTMDRGVQKGTWEIVQSSESWGRGIRVYCRFNLFPNPQTSTMHNHHCGVS